jgi:hypothetical protein
MSKAQTAIPSVKLPVRRRVKLLALLTAVGALMFAPFILVQSPGESPEMVVPLFTVITTGLAILAGIYGFRLNDSLGLPMPLLRPYERRQSVDRAAARRAILAGLISGAIIGLLVFAIASLADLPTNPGSLPVRLATFLWSSLFTETISHLLILALLLKLVRNKWVAILISGIIFTLLFHLGGEGSLAAQAPILILNFVGISVTGYLCITYGFESAVVAHAIMHLLLLGLN